MAIKISAVEARKKFGELLNRVSLMGEEIIIERSGKKIAKLTGASVSQKKKKSAKLDFRKSAGLGSDIWKEVDVEKYVKEERDNWE